jgi:hypothetical protein
MTKHERMMKEIEEHGNNLLALYPNATERDPVKLCKKLLKIEWRARQLTTDYCNGEFDPGKDWEHAEKARDGFLAELEKVLGKGGPSIHINWDARAARSRSTATLWLPAICACTATWAGTA